MDSLTQQNSETNDHDRAQNAATSRAFLARESPEHRAARNARRRAQNAEQRAAETIEQREIRLQHRRQRRAEETPEQRQIRLQRDRQRRRDRETPQQRARREQRERNALERQRELERRRALVQARLQPAMKCNMDTIMLFDDVHSYYNTGMCNHCCCHCGSLGFNAENRGTVNQRHHGILCCNKGKIMLEDLPELPPTMMHLFTSDDAASKHFRKKIRQFNAGMAMASFQANERTVMRGVPGAYKVVGQVYRRIGSLMPDDNSNAKCIQVYFLDPDYQASLRATRYTAEGAGPNQLDVQIFQRIHNSLTQEAHNTYISSFLTVSEWIQQSGHNPEEISIELHETERPSGGQHPGRYHMPTAPEVSILLPSREQMASSKASIVCSVRPQANEEGIEQLHIIRNHHRSYSPLAYPVFHPEGTDGWHLDLNSRNFSHARSVTLNEYCRWHMARDSHLHLGQKLYQQWIVDNWAREEARKLDYIRNNQKQIRADLYKGLQDANNGNEVDRSGRVFILPATHTGSDRWYHKWYKNAMHLVLKKGKPTFFLTMTMDVNCEEVRAHLRPGQSPYDRPDIICRIFEIKRKELLRLIKEEGIFGHCVAHVAVIEFQKRGAPHMHLLFWIENFDETPQNIDNVISAEIPPEGAPGSKERELHELVMKHMIHGPCGDAFRNNLSCMKNSKNGKCGRNFPKSDDVVTSVGDGCFPNYRRRSPQEGGNTGTKYIRGSETTISNRWVVAYNAYLLLKFKCHINIEYCHTVASIKYLFLYHFKGEDMVTVEGLDRADEIHYYASRRYVSACQAYWRSAEFDIVKMQPPVMQLPIHLPNQQIVVFSPNRNSVQNALDRNRRTMLTSFFETMERCPNDRDLKYEDMTERYSWHADSRMWTDRQRETGTFGRMVSVSPNLGDLFYMRLLLKHRLGPTSFEDLRTVEGELYPDFKGACIAMGLCDDDSQWIQAMEEAVQISHAFVIRELFCNILLHCHPTDPRGIFDQFCNSMREDFVHRRSGVLNMNDIQIEASAHNDLLLALNNTLEDHGRSNSYFGLDMPTEEELQEIYDEAEFDATAESFFNECFELLNNEQSTIFETIKSHIDNDEGGLYSFDAPGGSGKTFLANVLLAYARKDSKIALATAMSGIAAILLKLGTTFHRRFGVPVPCLSDSSSQIKLNSKEAVLIMQSVILMVDEVSMMNYRLLDLLDRFLKELMGNDQYMGGKLVILMHDFRQILPVIPQGSRVDIISAAVINSEIWNHIVPLKLRQNMRVQKMIQQNTCPEQVRKLQNYSRWLLDMGDGKLPSAVPNVQGIIEIPSQMVCKTHKEMEDKVFDNFLNNYNDPSYLQTRAIMSSTNDIIQQKNFEMVERLPGEMIISTSIDTCVEDSDVATFDAEILNKINASGIPPHRIALKVGACIILIRNLNVKHGHCNGTRYIIIELTPRLIKARKLSGGPNSEILIPRIPMVSSDTDFPVPFKRLQFPVLLAYYLTLNRAQGQSLDRAGIYLPKSVFSHGHLYVGCSRCGNPDCVFINADQSEFDSMRQHLSKDKTYTRNVVYPEIFPPE